MAARSVVEIDVKADSFKEFYSLFQKYQSQLNEMPDDWKKVIGAIDDAGDEMGDFSKSSKSSKEFLMIAAIQADAISKSMMRATGIQDKYNVKLKDGAIQMTRMQKASADMHKSISGMSSVLLKLGAVGGSGIAAAVGAIYGATNTVAGQNLQARGLGLRIGQTQAFGANFERFGLGSSDLSNIANAQGDVSKWRALISAGLTPDQIQNEDAEQLTYDFARAASGKYRDWQKSGMPAASMAQAYGFTDFLSQQQLRTGASYSDSDWMKAQQKEISDAKRNEINQGTADQASNVKAALSSDWAEVVNKFNGQLATAGPALQTLAGAAAAAAIKLLDIAGPQVKSLLDEMANPKPLPAGGLHPTLMHPNSLGQGFHAMGDALRQLGTFGTVSKTGDGGALGAPTLDSILDAQYLIESGGGKHLLSKKGAKGPFQFTDATWKQYGNGGDINNYADARAAARRMDIDMLHRYGGDVKKMIAAYNWGMGNPNNPRLDADIAANGANWNQHAPQETQNYITKLTQLLLKQGQNVNVNLNVTNSTSANVANSMNAAGH